jgi:hypothetical protein
MRIRAFMIIVLAWALVACAEDPPAPTTPDDLCAQDGQSFCGFGCADLTSDVDHCGECFNACADGDVCGDGQCACPDADGDGTCDEDDACVGDALKVAPGACGCGVADDDRDGDTTLDCDDGCPDDAAKVEPGACGCGIADDDTDGDGTLDCDDGCPGDAAKLSEGVCGCGVDDSDTDFDGVEDCNDGCPADIAKTTPGTCGCGISDSDEDFDGEICNDLCPYDANKTQPGTCGCGISDTGPWGPELADDGIDNDCSDGDLVASDATGVFVSETGSNSHPGTQAAPMATVAVGAAKAKDEGKVLYVSGGSYSGAANTYVSMYGGYTPGTWQRDIAANPTQLTHTSTTVGVRGAVVVEGFVLTNTGSSWSCNTMSVSSGADPITAYLVHNDIDGGSCQNSTGVDITGAKTTVHVFDNTIVGGVGTHHGTGISVHSGATAYVHHNTIEGGSGATSHGMGVYVEHDGATAIITNNLIFGGTGVDSKGNSGVRVEYDGIVFVANNYIHGGLNGNFASGVRADYGGEATVVNNIIDGGDGHWHADAADFVSVGSTSQVTLIHNVLFGATTDCLISASNTCVSSLAEVNACTFAGCGASQGNLTVDPGLVAAGDYHLANGSACIDAGVDPSGYGVSVDVDFDRQLRPLGVTWDIGPDEHTP